MTDHYKQTAIALARGLELEKDAPGFICYRCKEAYADADFGRRVTGRGTLCIYCDDEIADDHTERPDEWDDEC